MSQRWLGLALFLVLSTTRIAFASLTEPTAATALNDPIGGGATSVNVTLKASPSISNATLVAGANCTGVTVMPNTGVNINGGSGTVVSVSYDATTHPLQACVFTVMEGATNQGTFTINAKGLGPELQIVTASPLDFGSARVTGGTATANVAVKNNGDSVLSITGFVNMGGATTEFGTMHAAMFTIAAGATENLAFTFNPAMAGTRSTTLQISSDDPVAANATQTITLQGTGTNGVLSVTNVDFGVVQEGSAGTNSNITLSNIAAAPVGTVTVTGATIDQMDTWFSFAAGTGCTAGSTTCALTGISLGSDKTVAIHCQPPDNATGTQTATVTFTSDTDAMGSDSVADLTCTSGRSQITVTPLAVPFGDQLIGTSTTMDVAIMNTGNGTLTYNVAETDATNSYAITAGCTSNCSVAAMSATMLTIQFSPATTGSKTASFQITHNDFDTLPQTVSVTGNGVAPQISAPASLPTFGSVEIGKSGTAQTLTVTNTGGANLTITNAGLAGANAASYVVTNGTTGAQTTVLAPNGTAMWTINCSPQAQGAVNGTFRITSNTGNVAGTTTDVGLTCTGTQGLLVIDAPTSFDFGGVAVGNTAMHTFVLRNTGNLPVNTITVTPGGAGTGYTIVSPTFPLSSLAAGATVNVVVQFAPAAATDGNTRTFAFSGGWGTTPTTTMAIATVNGDGLAVGYDASPSNLAFGDFRFDTTPTRVFCVMNNGQADVTLTTMTLSVTAPTATGEVTIQEVRRRACGGSGGTLINPPYTNIALASGGQPIEVVVRMSPASRIGALAATVTINSNLASNPTRTVTITGNATTAAITTTPGATLDFGPTDLDAGPQTRDVVITNSGQATLDLASFARTANSAFTLTLPPTQSLAPGASLTIPVTYTPTMERPAGSEESFTLSHSIAGILGGPNMQMITVRGRGVDRHVDLAPAPEFPPTFRNPGSAAPVRAVTVRNTGDADLSVSAVMVTNDDVFQLVDAAPVVIPGQGSHDFMVRFVPKTAATITGDLVVVNNDNTSAQTMMAGLTLTGTGIARNVALTGGDPIELGYTGIGIPITLTGGLVVASMDAQNAFTIREIQIDDAAGVFSLPEAPENELIEASGSRAYDVTFAPTSEGEFTATAKLFLDEDTDQTAEVTLHGTAVFVDIGGGGGCATSRGGGAGGVLVVGALLLARRRRRARLAAVGAIAAAVAVAPPVAHAQSAQGAANYDLDLSLFDPTFSTRGQTLQVQTPAVGAAGEWVLGALVSNAQNPLVISYLDREHMSITRRTMMEVGGAYAFLGRFEAGLRMPLYNQTGDGFDVGVASPSGTARGDLVAHVRAQLAKTSGPTELIAGASLAVTFPTATGAQYAGVDKPTGRVLGLVALTPAALAKRLTVTANAGAVVRAKSELSNIQQGSGIAFGAAASLRIADPLWVFGEIYGDALPSARAPSSMETAGMLVTSEWLAGVTYRPDRRVNIGLAGGRGLVAGIGTPDVRAVFSLAFTPGRAELPPIHPPPPPFVDRDSDGDGIMDSADKCRDEREDMDGFQDGDGCPDVDNDGDGFLDSDDKCRDEAEDKDGVQDDDGCPDGDNDSDGVADAQDKCPNAAEDKDGFQDDDGCPELDNDGDGIADAQDKCPAQAETINGNADDDGCPDAGDSAIALTPSTLELMESIDFAGPRLKPTASKVLGQVAATLRAHPEILRVRVTVHVNPAGDEAAEKALTEQRAIAIREWLIKAGIPAERVSGAGMGGTKPLVKGKKSPVNERVEIIILERK